MVSFKNISNSSTTRIVLSGSFFIKKMKLCAAPVSVEATNKGYVENPHSLNQ